jgi:hypothetical protein
MTADNWLLLLVISLWLLTAYLIATEPDITDQDSKEMGEE